MWLATYIHLLSRLHIKNGDVVMGISWECNQEYGDITDIYWEYPGVDVGWMMYPEVDVGHAIYHDMICP
jgi:hypothetical protein